MKGQILVVREALPEERATVLRLLPGSAGEPFFIGKLVGEVVAALSLHLSGAAGSIEAMVVEERLRHLRIGTRLVREVAAQLAASGVTRLTARPEVLPSQFLERAGFLERDGLFELEIASITSDKTLSRSAT